jgi:WD40 repeat protein
MFRPGRAGLRLVTVGEDGTVRLWDTDSGQSLGTLMRLPDAVRAAALSPNRRRLLLVGRDRVVRLWDMDTEMPLAVLPSFQDDLTTGAYAMPDGRAFLVASADGVVKIYADSFPASLAGTLTDACRHLLHQPEFASVKADCPSALLDAADEEHF